MRSPHTDLAMEAREWYRQSEEGRREPPGVEVQEESSQGVDICRVRVFSPEGEKALGKPQGMYVTLNVHALQQRDLDDEKDASAVLAKELGKLLPQREKGIPVLVVGLGNEHMTPDALGPRAVEQIMVTRHIIEIMPDQIDERVSAVAAIAPGVLGTTGIETMEVVKGITDRMRPACVIAIDALAAMNVERMGSTIQITNTSIAPGSGLGRKIRSLSSEYLGVPFIAMGVPTVVYASAIVQEAVGEGGPAAYRKRETGPNLDELIVTPKEIDTLIQDAARVMALGINLALHPGVTIEEVQSFLH